MTDPADDRYPALMNQYSETLAICALPVLYLDGESAVHHGSGFLVKTLSHDYLVSAGHVFDPRKEGKELFFFVGDKKIRKLNGKLCGYADPLDIGVIQLSNEHPPPYAEVQKASIDIDLLAPGMLPRQNKQYMVTGFPASRTKFDWRSKQAICELRPFLSGSLPDEQYQAYGVKPHEHLLLNYDKKDFFNLGDDKQVTYPDPQGLSGAPVWLTLDRKNENDPTKTPLVGVVIEHDPKLKFMKVCDIGFAIALIHEFEKAV